jgi:hypothetical protein
MGLMRLMGHIGLMSPIGPICIRGREVELPGRQRVEDEDEDEDEDDSFYIMRTKSRRKRDQR